MNKDQEYLERYTGELEGLLLRLVQEEGLLAGKQFLETEDLTELYLDVVKPYLGDAVPDFEQYPLVSLGWIAFVGMALAVQWDADWEHSSALGGEQLYLQLRQPRGWDALDEYVTQEVLGLEAGGEEERRYTNFLRRAAEQTHSALMHEQAEPSSPLAFRLYTQSLYVLYRLGIALGLAFMGYRYERTALPN